MTGIYLVTMKFLKKKFMLSLLKRGDKLFQILQNQEGRIHFNFSIYHGGAIYELKALII